MKAILKLLVWIALYFLLLPYERLHILRTQRQQKARMAPMYQDAHYIHAPRTWLERLEDRFGIERPSSARDWRINITVAVATVQVVLIILATARVAPENLLLIPAFCLYTAMMLVVRQYRIGKMLAQG